MPLPKIHDLPIAVRVYPEPKKKEEEDTRPEKRSAPLPDAMLVFDTETRVDAEQRLTFGSYRWIESGRCLEEGIFYGDDLPQADLDIIKEYSTRERSHVATGENRGLRLLTRAQFAEKIFRNAYKARCLLVAFNFPFDISRIACEWLVARRDYTGGFSFSLSCYDDGIGNVHRPRIAIKQIDSKRARKGFTAAHEPDKDDLIPEGSEDGKPEKGYIFRGHFLDLRTLAFALTDRSYSLKSACKDFGVEHGKQPVARHGIVTPEYIDYNRSDVLATAELAAKLIEEYNKHRLALPATRAYSPASIGKAYLREMGIPPILERQPNFPKEYLGYAQTAFYGGRTSAHIRKIAVPVVYTDFLSMYPTVNSLMDLWQFVTAERITVAEHVQDEIEVLLKNLKPDDLFQRELWTKLPAFVRVIPDGDILPSRARYSKETNDWQVAVNYLYAQENNSEQGLWYSLPDVIASRILTGRNPTITDAFRLEAHDTLPSLKPVKLRGMVEVDPSLRDFFRVVIEERQRLRTQSDSVDVEIQRLDKALKVLANAASYGIYAEMNRQESEEKVIVKCQGIDAKPYTCRVAHPDAPGEYCFPPLASLITGAARLMLALLEHCVREAGGTYAMEDTDSMAIVASDTGNLKDQRRPKQTEKAPGGISELTREQVRAISDRFARLNPYERTAVPGSILKIEKDNFDPSTKNPRQIHCFAISAKRYALYILDDRGQPVLLRSSCPICGMKNKPTATHCAECKIPVEPNNEEDRWSEHGLGHLLNPTDPENEDREWIARIWHGIIRQDLNVDGTAVEFANAPAVAQIAVGSPRYIRPFESINKGRHYCDQIKPFNFLLSCQVAKFGHPAGVDPARFHLIAPYESDPKQWTKRKWIDQYSGKSYLINVANEYRSRLTARVETFGDKIKDYECHPESKCADINGQPSTKQTRGVLQRRHIRISEIKYIGKESNSLEEVEAGLIHSAQNVYTEYPDPKRDEWETVIRPALYKLSLSELEKSGVSRRTMVDARSGKRRPRRQQQEIILKFLQKRKLI